MKKTRKTKWVNIKNLKNVYKIIPYFVWITGCIGILIGVYGMVVNYSTAWFTLLLGVSNLSIGLFLIIRNSIMRELEYVKFDIKCLEERVEDVKKS